MRFHFGPSLSHTIKSALYYASTLCNSTEHMISAYEEDEKMLYTYLKSGTFVISEDIKVFIDEYEKVYALDEKLTREINGYFEADNVEIIRCFFETATEYTKNLVNISKQKDKIKILTFDFSWECDCLVNKKSFNTVHLPSKMFNDFKSDIENFMSAETKQRYVELELTPSRIYALYGPPGTGKTTLIHTTASYYSKNIATLTFDSNMCDRLFKTALKKIPADTILCLEDIDCIFREDRKSNESQMTFSAMINALDGICKFKNLIIFLTTNHLDRLDYALKRRVDYFIKFDFCTKEQVKGMFERFLPNETFEPFWSMCSKLKLTPSILQKFCVCNLHKKFEDYYSTISEFAESEYGLEKLPDMYT